MGALLLAGPARAENTVPSAILQEILIKTSLLTFNDANLTGNYTVMHAKLAKAFRDNITPPLETGVQGLRRSENRFGTRRRNAAGRIQRVEDQRRARLAGAARLLRHQAEPRQL